MIYLYRIRCKMPREKRASAPLRRNGAKLMLRWRWHSLRAGVFEGFFVGHLAPADIGEIKKLSENA